LDISLMLLCVGPLVGAGDCEGRWGGVGRA